MKPTLHLDVLLQKTDEGYEAHCLQFDLVEAAPTAEEVEQAIMDVITAQQEIHALSLTTSQPKDQHLVAVYLAWLTAGFCRATRKALGAIASLLTKGKGNAQRVHWAGLRYQHMWIREQTYLPTLERWISPRTSSAALQLPIHL
jgi:hypothetical protein